MKYSIILIMFVVILAMGCTQNIDNTELQEADVALEVTGSGNEQREIEDTTSVTAQNDEVQENTIEDNPILGGAPAQPDADTAASPKWQFTLADVAEHNTPEDCYTVVDGKVYDVTEYVPQHPNDKIKNGCGIDATDIFNSKHGSKAKENIENYIIGKIK